ncbi:MAG: hypothetical protein HYV40_01815, partial [Candidatus Levybacteria bacterium]|nr:hypothetical protein [Candidatus Levybacteria bacterium]
MLFLKTHWPQLTLLLLSLTLCILNYTPGTYLSGWDTLHPEFNFSLNFQRILFGVFRPEQGLGAVAAHAHMVELPRMLLLWILSPVIPLSFLRYSYIFLMLIIGPLGMYYLVRRVLSKHTTHHSQLIVQPSFLAALWYLTNLGTVQQFVVPFEMFVTEYGFLPWLFYFAISFLLPLSPSGRGSVPTHVGTGVRGNNAGINLLSIAKWLYSYIAIKRSNRPLLLFALLSFLASGMAYAATLWYMYFGFLALFLFLQSLPTLIKKDFSLGKRSLILLAITILVNAYWLLPNLYFAITQSATIQNANINKLFSEQAFLYNKEFGTPDNILLLKSFFFDWSIYNGRSFEPLLKVWAQHIKNPFILSIGFLTGVIAIFGVISSFIKKSFLNQVQPCTWRYSLLGLLVFVLIFLFNDNPPTNFLFHLIGKVFPILEEALRFPHNKVQILYMLVFAIYFGIGNNLLLSMLSKYVHSFQKTIITGYCVLLAILSLMFFVPAFQGKLLSPYMRIQLPNEYFQLFDFMNKQPDEARAAYLPVHSFWGWEYHQWGDSPSPSFQGAGFLWFGMKQPLLHRDFDRWSSYNEQAYKEFSFAVYSKNPTLLAEVARKYNTKYFI